MGVRITIARIEAIKIPDGKVEVKLWDSGVAGLCLRCFYSGGRSWAFRYREGGGGQAPVKTYKIGSYPAVSIDAARSAAKAHAALVAQGHSPAAVRHEARRREKSTLSVLLEEGGLYQRSLTNRGVVKIRPVMSTLRRGLSKYLSADIAKLTRRDLVEALDALNHLPGARHELRKHSRGLLEWATNAGLAPANVLAGLRLPPKTRSQRLEEAAKRRALDDVAIEKVWRAADRHGQYGSIVQLCLLTGLRRGEAINLSWSEILGDRILLMGDRTKTAAGHDIPLTDLMSEILEKQPRTTSPLVFPSSRTGRGLTGFVNLKKRLIDDANAGHFTLHDLRRTCRTLMSRTGVTEAVAELAIGHAPKGLVAVYNLDSSWSNRVDAFERVSDHVAELVGAA